MINRRNIVWMIPFLLLVSFPLWRQPIALFLAPRQSDEPSVVRRHNNAHNFAMDGVIILQGQQGKKTAEIRAEQALTGKKPNTYILVGVDADIIGDSGDITHVVAKEGNFNVNTKRLKLHGDVVVHKPKDNQYLYTERLYYYEKTRKVDCPEETRIIGDGLKIKGGYLKYDIRKDSYELGKRVHFTLNG